MKQERDAERDKRLAKKQAERTAAAEKQAKIEEVSHRLSALFGMNDKPHERGKQLEAVLNDLFRIYGILVCEDFRRKDASYSDRRRANRRRNRVELRNSPCRNEMA